MFSYVKQLSSHQFVKVFFVCIAWSILHMISANLYVHYCASFTPWGYVQSLFTAPMLHCKAMRYVINTGADNMQSAWILMGSWILVNLFSKIKLPEESSSSSASSVNIIPDDDGVQEDW